VGQAFGNHIARCLAADRSGLVRQVVLQAAGGLVPTDPDAARIGARLTAGVGLYVHAYREAHALAVSLV
jgi:hypothetical protein